MSNNLGDIISYAERLANRFKHLDISTSELLIEAGSNSQILEVMTRYEDEKDIDSFNKLPYSEANSSYTMNRRNQQTTNTRRIQRENFELKALLEDQQRTMELIMNKYREQMQSKIFETRIQFKDLLNSKFETELKRKSDKIHEMAAVMQKVASINDEDMLKKMEENSRLRIENQTLRLILKTAQEFGSIGAQPSIGFIDDNVAQNLSIDTPASTSTNILNSNSISTLSLTTTINNLNKNKNSTDKNSKKMSLTEMCTSTSSAKEIPVKIARGNIQHQF